MDINFAEPYENKIHLGDEVISLRWCNGTFLRAQRFAKSVMDKQVSFRELLELDGLATYALLYGATDQTEKEFLDRIGRLESFENSTEIIEKVNEGVMAYMPEDPSPVYVPEEGDEEWPEAVKTDQDSSELDFAALYQTMCRLGVTYPMFMRFTLRNCVAYMKSCLGEKQPVSDDFINKGGATYGER